MSEHAAELALEWARLGPFGALTKLGVKHERRGREAFVCCPFHKEKTPSCTVAIGQQGTLRVHCFGCSETWDIHSLVGQVVGIDTKSGFPSLLLHEAEQLGRWDIVDALAGKAERRPTPPPRAPDPEPEPEKTFPDVNEVWALIRACGLTACDHQVFDWLKSRALAARDVDLRGLAYALSPRATLPSWARFRGSGWSELGHRLIVPLYDATGETRSVRAGRIADGETPKRLPPAGHTCKGLVMADALAQQLLRKGCWPDWAPSHLVVIAEGEPDWMTWAVKVPLHQIPEYATLGIFSGSWTSEIAARIPDGSKVVVWTDQDAAGDKYAASIVETLITRCDVMRGRA